MNRRFFTTGTIGAFALLVAVSTVDVEAQRGAGLVRIGLQLQRGVDLGGLRIELEHQRHLRDAPSRRPVVELSWSTIMSLDIALNRTTQVSRSGSAHEALKRPRRVRRSPVAASPSC